jgi:hypothetical protein
MTCRTATLVCGIALALTGLVAQKGHASEVQRSDPTAAISICEFGSRIDDNGSKGK